MYNRYDTISYAESPFGTLNQFVAKTFGWMFAGLLVTFATTVAVMGVTGLVTQAVIRAGKEKHHD